MTIKLYVQAINYNIRQQGHISNGGKVISWLREIEQRAEV
jgi:hypothetical protein